MENQRSKILGDLYYDNTPRAFVPPPIKERRDLMQKKEDDYILTKNTVNEIDKTLRTLPYLEQSSSIYNNLKTKVEDNLSKINADNYSDSTLDVKQLANDMVNKYGGQQLVEEAQQMSNVQKVYDDAYDNGKIVDPDMVNWYKQKVVKNHRGLTVDENGYISKPNVQEVPFAEYQDMQKLLDERIKGWESDGTIQRLSDGSIKLDKSIPGYLSYGENTFISEEELLKAGMNYLQNDSKVQSYLKDKVEFDTRNIQADAQTLNELLTPAMKEALLGNSNADETDIQLGISNGEFNPNDVIKTLHKQKLIRDNSLFTADKYGYNKEKITTLSDTLTIEALKEKAKQRAKSQEQEDFDTAIVTVENFTTQQVLNTASIKHLNKTKDNLSQQRKDLQIEINEYQKGFNENRDGYSIEQLEDKNKKQTRLDQQIAEIETQERQLEKIMLDNGKKAGINFEKQYSESLPNIKKLVKEENINKLLLEGTGINSIGNEAEIDVTDLIKIDKNNKPYIPLPDGSRFEATDGMTSYDNIIFKNNKYIFRPTKSNKKNTIQLLDEIINPNTGKFTNRVKFFKEGYKDEVEKKLSKIPSKEEYLNTVIDAYNEKEDSTNFIGINKDSYRHSNGKTIIDNATLKSIEQVRNKLGEFEWEVAQPLEYLLVTGDSAKSNLRAYTNREKANLVAFRGDTSKGIPSTVEQYKINTPEGVVSIQEYLEENYGIESLSPEFIDWDNSGLVTLTETDREFGQKYGISFSLTKEGMEELNSKGKTNFQNKSQIKLVGVNPSKNIPQEQAEIQDTLLKTYKEVVKNGSNHSINISKEMGRVYLDNSPEGKALDELNLYTLPAGQMKTWKVRDTNYNIISTTRDAQQSDLRNVDFHLSYIDNNQQMVMAKDNNTGETVWKPLNMVENDKNYTKVFFNSPADIKAVVGAKLLDTDSKNNINAYSDVEADNLNTYGYKNTGDNQTRKNNYNSVVRGIKNYYEGDNQTITLSNYATGKEETFTARIPKNDLTDLSKDYSDRIAPNTAYPYINKEVVPYLDSILEETNLTITGGFRGEATHFGLANSSENSLHKYAYALDFRADEAGDKFFNEVNNNGALLDKYGIVSILRHGNPLHIHVEFKPNKI